MPLPSGTEIGRESRYRSSQPIVFASVRPILAGLADTIIADVSNPSACGLLSRFNVLEKPILGVFPALGGIVFPIRNHLADAGDESMSNPVGSGRLGPEFSQRVGSIVCV